MTTYQRLGLFISQEVPQLRELIWTTVIDFDEKIAKLRAERSKSEIIPPQPILLRRSAPVASEQGLTDSELLLDLLIDSAGKVRSVEPAGNPKSADPDLLKAGDRMEVCSRSQGRSRHRESPASSRIRETIIAHQRRGTRIRGA